MRSSRAVALIKQLSRRACDHRTQYEDSVLMATDARGAWHLLPHLSKPRCTPAPRPRPALPAPRIYRSARIYAINAIAAAFLATFAGSILSTVSAGL